jgi:hypothetical protein
LEKGEWKSSESFHLHNPSNNFFHQLWIKLKIFSDDLTYEDIKIVPPSNLTEAFIEMGETRVNSSLFRLDGIDPEGKNAIYLILDTFEPKKTYSFQVRNRATEKLSTSTQYIELSIIGSKKTPSEKSQYTDSSGGIISVSPPEKIRLRRQFILGDQNRFILGEIGNPTGEIWEMNKYEHLPSYPPKDKK